MRGTSLITLTPHRLCCSVVFMDSVYSFFMPLPPAIYTSLATTFLPHIYIYKCVFLYFLSSVRKHTNKNCGNYIKGSTLAQLRDILLSFGRKPRHPHIAVKEKQSDGRVQKANARLENTLPKLKDMLYAFIYTSIFLYRVLSNARLLVGIPYVLHTPYANLKCGISKISLYAD